VIPEMARGSIGRERMLTSVVGISAHQQPPGTGLQEDLNNELLAVSPPDTRTVELKFNFGFLKLRREQEMQQQKLWRDFQEQKKELELQHKMQIENKLQVSLVFLLLLVLFLLFENPFSRANCSTQS
jgi:hypothetical protein